MKIRNSSRITAIVLALVMLLPLISIPTFAEENENVLFSEDFSSYAGLEGDALKTALTTKWRAYAKNIQFTQKADTEDTYARFPIASIIDPGSEFDTEYFLYANYTKWDKATNGTPIAYNKETGKVTFSEGTAYPEGHELDVDATSASADGKLYGTVSFGGSTWTFATGEYAACAKFGDGAIDKLDHIQFGDNELYTELDPEVLAGTKKVGDIKTRYAGISYTDAEKVIVSYEGMIEPGSKGELNMQLNYFKDSTGGEKMYLELGNLNLATGVWGGCLSGVTMPQGEWIEIAYIIDMKTGIIQGLYDGKIIGSTTISAKGTAPITGLTGWTIGKIFKKAPEALAGSWNVDNVKVQTGAALGGMLTYNDYSEDFESYEAGYLLNASSKWTGQAAYEVADYEGSKVWKLHAGINNNNPRIKNELISADMGDKWTYGASYKIPADTQTQLQTQGYNAFVGLKADGSAASVTWGDLFVIKAYEGHAWLKREGGNDSGYPLPLDQWFDVTMEFTLSNATYDVYVNGVLALANQAIAGGLVSVSTINANSIIVAKENSAAKTWATGNVYIDNVYMKKGECGIDPIPSFDLITEWNSEADDALFSYLPSTITDMNDAFAVSGNYSGIAGAEITLDEDEYIESFYLALDDTIEGNLDKMLRPRTPGFDFDVYKTVVLNATYNVSADAQGKSQSELFDSALQQWKSLYTIDATASTINGAAFTKGEEFTVTTVVTSSENGAYANSYYNNVLINSVAIANNGLNGAEWSVAKLVKNCEAYAGKITMTAVTIETELADEKSENALYLYDQADMVAVNADLLTAVNAASIRLFESTGLRFATEIDMDALAPIASDMIKIGTLIAPAEYVEAAGAFTREALAETKWVNAYIDVKAELNNLYNGNGASAALPEGDYFTASIVKLRQENIGKDFAAIGYVEYTVNGETFTYYCSDYTVANIQEIAAAAQEDFADTEYAGIINAYAAGLQPKY